MIFLCSCDPDAKKKTGAKQFENELDFDVEAGPPSKPSTPRSRSTSMPAEEQLAGAQAQAQAQAQAEQAAKKKAAEDALSVWSGVKLDAPPEFKARVKEEFFF